MKKLTLGILCLSLCACLALTSCQNKKDDTADNTTDDSSVSDLAGIVLPKDEEEDIPATAQRLSPTTATSKRSFSTKRSSV